MSLSSMKMFCYYRPNLWRLHKAKKCDVQVKTKLNINLHYIVVNKHTMHTNCINFKTLMLLKSAVTMAVLVNGAICVYRRQLSLIFIGWFFTFCGVSGFVFSGGQHWFIFLRVNQPVWQGASITFRLHICISASSR